MDSNHGSKDSFVLHPFLADKSPLLYGLMFVACLACKHQEAPPPEPAPASVELKSNPKVESPAPQKSIASKVISMVGFDLKADRETVRIGRKIKSLSPLPDYYPIFLDNAEDKTSRLGFRGFDFNKDDHVDMLEILDKNGRIIGRAFDFDNDGAVDSVEGEAALSP